MADEKLDQPALQEEEERKEKGILIVFRFVIVPIVIVGVVVSIIVLFGRMALKEKSVKDYLYDIRTGSQSERWQAAYHLSNLLANPRKDYRIEARKELPEMILIFEAEKGKDPQIRRYLALALGSLQDNRAVPPLQKALEDPDPQTVMYSVWALGNIGDQSSAPLIIQEMENSDSGIRMMSAYVLGALGDRKAIPPLQAHLDDSAVEVRWNAAIALSRMKDASGAEILLNLMKREYLAQFTYISEAKKEELMMEAIKASMKLNHQELTRQVKKLSTEDPSPKVRNVALQQLPH